MFIKHAGCNKAVQVGIFQKLILKESWKLEKFQKLINVQNAIRLCRLEIFKKIMLCAVKVILEIDNFWFFFMKRKSHMSFILHCHPSFSSFDFQGRIGLKWHKNDLRGKLKYVLKEWTILHFGLFLWMTPCLCSLVVT